MWLKGKGSELRKKIEAIDKVGVQLFSDIF